MNAKDNKVKLQRDEFSRLDHIARTKAGIVLIVRHWESSDLWGLSRQIPVGVYKDDRITSGAGVCTEVGGIEIANQIDLSAFYSANRPELEISAIPSALIYDYVLWHEIGHKMHNYFFCEVVRKLEAISVDQSGWINNIKLLNEVLADRFAWRRLFPDREMPISDKCMEENPGVSGETPDGLMEILSDLGIEPFVKHNQPLTTEPGKYVPVDHVRFGIQWAA